MVRPMVHSTKHYVQVTFSTALTVARNSETLITSVQSTVANLGNEVAEGASIKAVYIEMWVAGSTIDQFFTAIVAKLPSGLTTPSFAEMTDLFTWENKKNIFYTTQGLASSDNVGPPVAILRGWIKIPKSKQRFGLGDKLVFVVASRGDADINYCGFATYKEYT